MADNSWSCIDASNPDVIERLLSDSMEDRNQVIVKRIPKLAQLLCPHGERIEVCVDNIELTFGDFKADGLLFLTNFQLIFLAKEKATGVVPPLPSSLIGQPINANQNVVCSASCGSAVDIVCVPYGLVLKIDKEIDTAAAALVNSNGSHDISHTGSNGASAAAACAWMTATGCLSVICKDIQHYVFTFWHQKTTVSIETVYENIMKYALPPSMQKLFAFSYPSKAPINSGTEAIDGLIVESRAEAVATNSDDGWNLYDPIKEYERMGVDVSVITAASEGNNTNRCLWRLTDINSEYRFSPTYPRLIAIPMAFQENKLKGVAQFRSKGRIPALCWRHPKNFSTITRCSQPLTGISRSRCKEDEDLLRAILYASAQQQKQPQQQLQQQQQQQQQRSVAQQQQQQQQSPQPVRIQPLSFTNHAANYSHFPGTKATSPSNSNQSSPTASASTNNKQAKQQQQQRRKSLKGNKSNASVSGSNGDDGGSGYTFGALSSAVSSAISSTLNYAGISSESPATHSVTQHNNSNNNNSKLIDVSTQNQQRQQQQSGQRGAAQKRAFLWSTVEDEHFNNPAKSVTSGDASTSSGRKLYIVDCRSRTNALANTAMGKGYENVAYYENCEILFMNIDNIHQMRDSLARLYQACLPRSTHDPYWPTTLISTSWLEHIRLILVGTLQVVQLIENGHSVVIHCSDGWDRTSQLSSLAQLLLDPYYRTVEGFEILIEKEWLSFGHKFNDRCGHMKHSEDEQSPVFLQWIDCVWQVMQQFPTAFEFNESFLMLLVRHTYSCKFGTFLYNSEKERADAVLRERTTSLWTVLNAAVRKQRALLCALDAQFNNTSVNTGLSSSGLSSSNSNAYAYTFMLETNASEWSVPLLNPFYRHPNCCTEGNAPAERSVSILIPDCRPSRLQLWRALYMRHQIDCTSLTASSESLLRDAYGSLLQQLAESRRQRDELEREIVLRKEENLTYRRALRAYGCPPVLEKDGDDDDIIIELQRSMREDSVENSVTARWSCSSSQVSNATTGSADLNSQTGPCITLDENYFSAT